MAEILFDPESVRIPSGCLINGELVPGTGEAFAVLRPSDGRLIRDEYGASADMVGTAVALARKSHASGVWCDATPQHRAQVFRRWADLAQARAEDLVRLEAVSSTRLAAEAAARDVPMTIATIRYFGEMIEKVEGQVLTSPSDAWSLTFREPHGVVAAISPWNVPLLLATVKIAPALAAGNAVVLKPSELTPYSIVLLAQLAIEAGVPPGHLAVLPGTGPQAGHALVTHPDVDYVTFTGSTATGAQVMADAALSGPRPVSIELGGKSPQLVFADADLDATARIVAGSAMRNAGQICYAGTRLIVEEAVADELTHRIAMLMDMAQPGPTWSAATTLSPVVSRKQGERIARILARGVEEGAEVVCGGKQYDMPHAGVFFKPTLVRNVSATNPVVKEEIFGPVLAVQTFRGIEEGLALADHDDYGLAAGVYTRDIGTAMKCSRKLQVGSVWVNHYGTADVLSPVGGYKRSGFGKDFGAEGFAKYFKTKHVWMKGM